MHKMFKGMIIVAGLAWFNTPFENVNQVSKYLGCLPKHAAIAAKIVYDPDAVQQPSGVTLKWMIFSEPLDQKTADDVRNCFNQ